MGMADWKEPNEKKKEGEHTTRREKMKPHNSWIRERDDTHRHTHTRTYTQNSQRTKGREGGERVRERPEHSGGGETERPKVERTTGRKR